MMWHKKDEPNVYRRGTSIPSLEIETNFSWLSKTRTIEQGKMPRWPSFAKLKRWKRSASKSYCDLYAFADALSRILDSPPRRSTVAEREVGGGSGKLKLAYDSVSRDGKRQSLTSQDLRG